MKEIHPVVPEIWCGTDWRRPHGRTQGADSNIPLFKETKLNNKNEHVTPLIHYKICSSSITKSVSITTSLSIACTMECCVNEQFKPLELNLSGWSITVAGLRLAGTGCAFNNALRNFKTFWWEGFEGLLYTWRLTTFPCPKVPSFTSDTLVGTTLDPLGSIQAHLLSVQVGVSGRLTFPVAIPSETQNRSAPTCEHFLPRLKDRCINH